MSKMRCMIVDDHPEAVHLLEDYAAKLPSLSVIYSTTDPLEALNKISNTMPDLLFLDIEMAGVNGLDFFKVLDKHTKVVLCSAHKNYAYDGFQNDVVDFLYKPFSLADFIRAVHKVERTLLPGLARAESVSDFYFFLVKGPDRLQRRMVLFDDIIYIESKGTGVRVHLHHSYLETNLSLWKLYQILPKRTFVKVNRSTIISVHYYQEYHNKKIKLRYVDKQVKVGNEREAQDFFNWQDRHTLG